MSGALAIAGGVCTGIAVALLVSLLRTLADPGSMLRLRLAHARPRRRASATWIEPTVLPTPHAEAPPPTPAEVSDAIRRAG